jgi:hypothetical protein
VLGSRRASGACRFQVEFLAGAPPNMRGEQPVCALHGPEASTEVAMLAMLRSPSLRALPLLPALLQPPLTTPRNCAVQGERRKPRMLPCICDRFLY